MTTPIKAICEKRGCKWFRGWKPETLEPVCMAYPEGIPEAILSGHNKHTEPLSDDGGYKFSPKKIDIKISL